jgi:uncharacterized protein (TIGR02391 family)
MSTIINVFPPIEVALELEPEDLSVHLLECLCRFEEETSSSGMLNKYSFIRDDTFKGYCEPHQYDAIEKAVTEAWVWLEREGLIAPKPGDSTGMWIFITRRGKKLRGTGEILKFKAASLLPHQILDSRLALKVRPAFLRGDYESAVFGAFKEIEVRVREVAKLGSEELGVNLMRKAFKPEKGVLIDSEQTISEQQGIADLFTGAIASFKNPSSHRDVNFTDPVEVTELIMFADLLIRIVDRRKPEEK